MAKLLAIQYRVTELCSPADSEARRDETAYWDAVECVRAIRESERPEAREQIRRGLMETWLYCGSKLDSALGTSAGPVWTNGGISH